MRSKGFSYAQIEERLDRTQQACRLRVHSAVGKAAEEGKPVPVENWRPGRRNKGKAAAAAAPAPAAAAAESAPAAAAAESAAGSAADEEDAAAAVDADGDTPMAGTAGTEGLAMLCAAAAADSHRARDDAETAAIDAAIAAGDDNRVRALVSRVVDEKKFLAEVDELGGGLWKEIGARYGEYPHTLSLFLCARR